MPVAPRLTIDSDRFKREQVAKRQFKNTMEKSSALLTQQIRFLKKSLKNKRSLEIWEQCIQFYRNNAGSVANYHILKLIKIAMKPLKSTILRNCRYLSKLALRQTKRPEDKKVCSEIDDQQEFLRNKLKALVNLLDCYTLAMQMVLLCSDTQYFNMMHRQDYRALHTHKELIFEPIPFEHEQPIPQTQLEHEMSSYFNFVCEAGILFSMGAVCWGTLRMEQLFQGVNAGLKQIFASSAKFSTRELEYECLKINYLAAQSPKRLHIWYQFPIETFHRVYKCHKKWEAKHVTHYYNMLLRYVFHSLLNINKPNMIFPQYQAVENLGIVVETQIFIYMREMLNLYRVIYPNSRLNKQQLELMSAIVDSYEERLGEMKIWAELLGRYFDYSKLSRVPQKRRDPSLEPNLKQIAKLVLIKQDGLMMRSAMSRQQQKKGKFNSRTTQQFHISQRVEEGFAGLLTQMGSIFSREDEASSDSEGNIQHKFEKQRWDEICAIQNSRDNKRTNRFPALLASTISKQEQMQILDLREKLEGLHRKSIEVERESVQSLLKLHNLRKSSQYQLRLNIIDEQNSRLQESILGLNPDKNEQKHLRRTSAPKLHQKRTETKLPILGVGENREKSRVVKQHQPIVLSDKYDRMSRNLLLTNTNRERNYVT